MTDNPSITAVFPKKKCLHIRMRSNGKMSSRSSDFTNRCRGIGLICQLAADSKLTAIKEQINLNRASVVLCFSTEGDTDPENYRAIVNGQPV
jgi:hypothetical protein